MLDYNQLFAEQPAEVRQQLPERLRSQLEAGTDYLVLDENEFHGAYRGGELARIQVVDFNVEPDEEYSCKFRIQMKAEPDWSEDGPNEDEDGNTFFTRLVPFLDEDGERTQVEDLPGEENNGFLSGFKSYKIRLDELLEAELINEDLYSYLHQQAQKWTKFVLDNGGNQQAPYIETDDSGRSMLNQLSGLVSCDYLDLSIDIRQSIQYGSIDRYGIDDLNIEGLKRLQTSSKVEKRGRRDKSSAPAKKAKKEAKMSKKNRPSSSSAKSSNKKKASSDNDVDM